jgi:diguanylate cyclase (GGDEF)-like protein
MDPASPGLDVTAVSLQAAGALIFGAVFLFLYRQSKVLYFGFWAIAWGLRVLAAVLRFPAMRSGIYLALYALLEVAFAFVLVAAARAGFSSGDPARRIVLRWLLALPILLVAVDIYPATFALVLCLVYLYNFWTLRKNGGAGARIFQFSLLSLSLLYLYQASARLWGQGLRYIPYYEFGFHGVLTFAAMAMWSESQIGRIRALTTELDHLRREAKNSLDLDRLTGLLNQSALAARVESPGIFEGAVAVCDMDNFKEINDRYGHLVGDEILRNIGHLLQSSIRSEDEAFRWGGDEFVVLFRNQQPVIAARRMAEIETRLREFRVRGVGVLPISFSWGTADGHDRALREALDEADRAMYALKRSRAAEKLGQGRDPGR